MGKRRDMHERLRRGAPAEFVRMLRFAAVGGLNTAIDFALFALLLYGLGLPVLVANSAAYGVAVVNSFVLNRYWTFAATGTQRRAVAQFPLFLALNLVGLGLSNLTLWTLGAALTPLGAKAVATLVTFAWNYWSSRRFVYMRPSRIA